MKWILQTQERDQWSAVANEVIIFRFPKNTVNFMTTDTRRFLELMS